MDVRTPLLAAARSGRSTAAPRFHLDGGMTTSPDRSCTVALIVTSRCVKYSPSGTDAAKLPSNDLLESWGEPRAGPRRFLRADPPGQDRRRGPEQAVPGAWRA